MTKIYKIVFNKNTESWLCFKEKELSPWLRRKLFSSNYVSYVVETDENNVILFDEYKKENKGKIFKTIYHNEDFYFQNSSA